MDARPPQRPRAGGPFERASLGGVALVLVAATTGSSVFSSKSVGTVLALVVPRTSLDLGLTTRPRSPRPSGLVIPTMMSDRPEPPRIPRSERLRRAKQDAPENRMRERRRQAAVRQSPLESWGAFDVGPHRMGASTVSWGDKWCGWAPHLKKSQRIPGMFGLSDISDAYNLLAAPGGVSVWEVAAGSPGIALLGECQDVNPQFDSPRVMTRCAPRLLPDRIKTHFKLPNGARGWQFGKVRYGAHGVAYAVQKTQIDLGVSQIDLLAVGPRDMEKSASVVKAHVSEVCGLGMAVDEVGVANVKGGAALRAAHRAFQRRGKDLVACAVDFNVLQAGATRDGTLKVAKELDITVFARSPLASGLGSGKYVEGDPSNGIAFPSLWRARALREVAPVHDALERVARMVSARRTGARRKAAERAGQRISSVPPGTVTPTQVALHWCIAKGAVPLPAVKTRAQAEEILGCRNWFLTREEVAELDKVVTYKLPRWRYLRKQWVSVEEGFGAMYRP